MRLLKFTIALLAIFAVVSCASSEPKVEGISSPVTKDAIRAAIRENKDHFTKCYNQALKRKKGFEKGTVHLQFEINQRGKAEKATLREPPGDVKFEKCLVTTVEKIKFPVTPKDQFARVVYPIVFNPQIK